MGGAALLGTAAAADPHPGLGAGALGYYGEDPEPDGDDYHGVRPGTEPGLRPVPESADAEEALRGRRSVGGSTLYYEVTGERSRFTFDDGFYRELVVWRDRLGGYVPRVWGGAPSRISSYGAYVNKPGYHGRGRAFDIASVWFTTRRGTLVKRFDCRYDQWRSSADRAEIRVLYWALAASLHHRFRHVLTYLYDGNHHTHIHVDNAVYGGYQEAEFHRGSSSQVQHVQACCRYVWGYRTRITDTWNRQTRRHSTLVLRRFGVDNGTILDSNYNWRMFNYATLLHGTGKVSL